MGPVDVVTWHSQVFKLPRTNYHKHCPLFKPSILRNDDDFRTFTVLGGICYIIIYVSVSGFPRGF